MENSTLSQYEGDTVTLSCSLKGTFTFPEWRGPPSLRLYTNKDDSTINPAAPPAAEGRLQYANNKRDLILSNVVIADSGDYQCAYTGHENHTITLEVNPAPAKATLSVDTSPSTYGTTETLKCTDPTYMPGHDYIWKKNGKTIFTQAGEVSPTGKYSESIDGTTFKLIINDIDVSDEGSYTANHAYADSNTLNLEVESKGTVTAKITSEKLLEVTFKQIYPDTNTAVITCDNKIVPGSFITSDADGDRFTKTWKSTEPFTTVPKTCSAEITLRTKCTIGFTFTQDEKPDSDGFSPELTGAAISGAFSGAIGAGAAAAGVIFCIKSKGKEDSQDKKLQ